VTVWWTDCSHVWSATRPAGGSFAAPQQVPNPDPQDLGTARYGEAADGTLVAAFDNYWGVYAAVRPPGGKWTTTTLDKPEQVPGPPRVAVNAAGDALVTWLDTNYAMAAYRPRGGSFGPTVRATGNISPPDPWMAPAMSPSGTATIAYSEGGVWATTGRGTTWSTPERISPVDACTVDATSDREGGTWVTWWLGTQGCVNGDGATLYATSRAPGQTWSGRADVLSHGPAIFPPRIAPVGKAGVIIAWPQGYLGPSYDQNVFTIETSGPADAPAKPAPRPPSATSTSWPSTTSPTRSRRTCPTW